MRALKIAVIAMGVIILVGFAIVAAELARRAFLPAETPSTGEALPTRTGAAPPAALALPAGARIAAMETLGDRLVLLVEEGEVQRLMLVDPAALPLTTEPNPQ